MSTINVLFGQAPTAPAIAGPSIFQNILSIPLVQKAGRIILILMVILLLMRLLRAFIRRRQQQKRTSAQLATTEKDLSILQAAVDQQQAEQRQLDSEETSCKTGTLAGKLWIDNECVDAECRTLINSSGNLKQRKDLGTEYVFESSDLPEGAEGHWTLSMWVRVNEGPTGEFRSIFHKGNSLGERSPAIWLHRQDNRLHCRISTKRVGGDNDGINTVEQLPIDVWTLVTWVQRGRTMEIYFNESLAGSGLLPAEPAENVGKIRLPNPWSEAPDLDIADLKWCNQPIEQEAITAQFRRGL